MRDGLCFALADLHCDAGDGVSCSVCSAGYYMDNDGTCKVSSVNIGGQNYNLRTLPDDTTLGLANKFCIQEGMRLPTASELNAIYSQKGTNGIPESGTFWTSDTYGSKGVLGTFTSGDSVVLNSVETNTHLPSETRASIICIADN